MKIFFFLIFEENCRYYKGMRGSSEDAESRASGAYIFRLNIQVLHMNSPYSGDGFLI